MMFAAPDLSGDVWRYLWDGDVSIDGRNPYALPPSDPSLEPLRSSWHGEINHPEIRTVYPPYAQLLFVISALGGGSLWLWRLVLLLVETISIVILHRMSPWSALLWAICPLAVWEGFWSAHVDLAAGTAILLALFLAARPVSSGVAIGVATGIKLMPAVAVPALFAKSSRPWRHLAAFAITLACSVVPFVGRPFMAGFGEYARRWSFNGLVYDPLVSTIDVLSVDEHLRSVWGMTKDLLGLESISSRVYAALYPEFLARVVLASILVVGLIVIAKRAERVAEGAADSLGLLLLLSPTVHPWYWLPVSVVSIAAGRTIWLFLAAGSIFSYLIYEGVDTWVVLTLSYVAPIVAWWSTRASSKQSQEE